MYSLLLLYFEVPHFSPHRMIAAYCYTQSSVLGLSVCMYVCLSVGHVREPCKTVEPWTERDAVWGLTQVGPSRKPCQWCLQWLCHLGHFKNSFDWFFWLTDQMEAPILQGKGQFWDVVRSIEKYREPLQRCTQKLRNRSRWHLKSWLMSAQGSMY